MFLSTAKEALLLLPHLFRVLFVIDGVLGAFFFVNLMIQLHSPVRVSANFYQLLVQYGMGVFRVYRTKVRLTPYFRHPDRGSHSTSSTKQH